MHQLWRRACSKADSPEGETHRQSRVEPPGAPLKPMCARCEPWLTDHRPRRPAFADRPIIPMTPSPQPESVTRRIKRIAPLQVGKMLAIVYAAMGLLFIPYF